MEHRDGQIIGKGISKLPGGRENITNLQLVLGLDLIWLAARVTRILFVIDLGLRAKWWKALQSQVKQRLRKASFCKSKQLISKQYYLGSLGIRNFKQHKKYELRTML